MGIGFIFNSMWNHTCISLSLCFRIACLRTNATHAVAVSQSFWFFFLLPTKIFAVYVRDGGSHSIVSILFYRLINIAFDSNLNYEKFCIQNRTGSILFELKTIFFPHLKHNKSERYSWGRCSVISTAPQKKI